MRISDWIQTCALPILPVLLSYFGVSASAAQRSLRDQQRQAGHRGVGRLWDVLAHFTERRWASVAIAVAILLAIGGYATSRHLQIGDLDPRSEEHTSESRHECATRMPSSG